MLDKSANSGTVFDDAYRRGYVKSKDAFELMEDWRFQSEVMHAVAGEDVCSESQIMHFIVVPTREGFRNNDLVTCTSSRRHKWYLPL